MKGRSRGKSRFNHGMILGFAESSTRFSLDLTRRPVFLVICTCVILAEKLLGSYCWLQQRDIFDLAIHLKVHFCKTDHISTRVTSKNLFPIYFSGSHVVS